MSLEEIYSGRIGEGNQLIEVTVTGTGVQYFAEGLKGMDPEAAAFKCWAVFPVADAGVTGRHVRHAEGLQAPGWNGENLPGLNYLLKGKGVTRPIVDEQRDAEAVTGSACADGACALPAGK